MTFDEKNGGSNALQLEKKQAALKSTIRFVWISSLIFLAFVVIGLIFVPIDHLFTSVHVAIASLLGILLTYLVSVGLMALVFYSSRAGYDDDVGPPDTL